MRIFLAGASGVIGQRLIPRLVQAGHVVGGLTRSPSKTELLSHLGAEPILCDVFDREALIQALRDDGSRTSSCARERRLSSHAPAPAIGNDYSGPTRQLTDQLISGRVNSAACNLTKSCMLIGFRLCASRCPLCLH